MTHDLLIKNGTLIDGTGAPRRRADIAISAGKIAAIGGDCGPAHRVIDAADLMVAPGIVDPHTHYDAQICWDSMISPSSWHGVTTVVMGNCGVGIAPCRPDMHEVASRDLVNVEGIPAEILDRGITWDWESFPQFMAAAERRPKAVNLAFLAPLTPFRHYVMREQSQERAADAEETQAIRQLLKEAVSAGAFGFSTSVMETHIGFQGKPLACRNASMDELRAYAGVLKELGKGAIEIALCKQPSIVTDVEYGLLDALLTESGRPVTWLTLLDRDDKPDAWRDSLKKVAPLLARGAWPQSTPLPLTRELSLRTPFTFVTFPCFKAAFNRSLEEQKALYADPGFRSAFKAELKDRTTRRWDRIVVNEVKNPVLKRFENCFIADLAKEAGKDGVDVFLDLALEDNLETEFVVATLNVTDARVQELVTNPNILIGLGDAGAHVAMTCDAGYCTFLLGKWVREKQAMSFEEAIRKLTTQPAAVFGIKDRGRLAEGLAGDVMIFDPATIGSAARGFKQNDLPGGAPRFVTASQGVHYTIANGDVVYEGGKTTGVMGGRVLRS